MGSESIAHEAEGWRPNGLYDWEAMRARGIYRFSKIQLVGQKNIFRKLKLDFNPFLSPKHNKYGGRFSLLVGYNI